MEELSGVRVFLSFDVDYDTDLGDRVSDHSNRRGSGFSVAARSQPGAMTERWHAGLRRGVRDADEVIVICGEHTAKSERMTAELRIAREENKPLLLLWGRRERMCSMPLGVNRSACMYSWTSQTLLHQIGQTLRDARRPEIPPGCKRT